MPFSPFTQSDSSTNIKDSTTSNLAIVPAFALPAYSASKAALNAFILCLRDQLRNSSVKIIEVSPPPVQSESTCVETSYFCAIADTYKRNYTTTWIPKRADSSGCQCTILWMRRSKASRLEVIKSLLGLLDPRTLSMI